MIGIAEISGGLGSLKMAKEFLQGLNSLKTEGAVNEARVRLGGLILDAQESLLAAKEQLSAASNTIRDLEAEVVRLKDWSGEKQRYELRKFYPGSLAYVLKPSVADGEPLHMLCKHCFDRTEKGSLQPTGRHEQRYSLFKCQCCKGEAPFGEPMPESADKRLGGEGA